MPRGTTVCSLPGSEGARGASPALPGWGSLGGATPPHIPPPPPPPWVWKLVQQGRGCRSDPRAPHACSRSDRLPLPCRAGAGDPLHLAGRVGSAGPHHQLRTPLISAPPNQGFSSPLPYLSAPPFPNSVLPVSPNQPALEHQEPSSALCSALDIHYFVYSTIHEAVTLNFKMF